MSVKWTRMSLKWTHIFIKGTNTSFSCGVSECKFTFLPTRRTPADRGDVENGRNVDDTPLETYIIPRDSAGKLLSPASRDFFF